jgi:hypothetical protein
MTSQRPRHVGINAASARTDHWLRMLCAKQVNRQVVDRNVNHAEKAEYRAKLGSLLAIRQVRAQHEVGNENQQ